MLTWLLILLIVFTLFATYVFWIRPVLKSRPSFAEYYEKEQSFWSAARLKIAGLKQKLATAAVFIAGIVVTFYDAIIALARQVGFDWGNVQTLTSKVPPQAWPIIGMVLIGMVQWFRNLAEKRTTEALMAKGLDPAPILSPPVK